MNDKNLRLGKHGDDCTCGCLDGRDGQVDGRAMKIMCAWPTVCPTLVCAWHPRRPDPVVPPAVGVDRALVRIHDVAESSRGVGANVGGRCM